MTVTDEFVEANKTYQQGFNGPLPLPPARQIAVDGLQQCVAEGSIPRSQRRHHGDSQQSPGVVGRPNSAWCGGRDLRL